MNEMILPQPLRPGDKVALVAPCSPVLPERLAYAAKFIEDSGYIPEIFPSCGGRLGFLAGDDRLRAGDINRAFADKAIGAVVVIRGGYGGARLANLLDYDIIQSNPKIFCGFSDATVLHLLINQRCGLVTFHAPMPAAANFPEDRWMRDSLADVLSGGWCRSISSDSESDNAGVPLECLCAGSGEGMLTGGNLTIIASTAGTPYQLDCHGKILFLEDVSEYAYAIDRSILHLRHSGILDGCRGIILGTWKDCAAPADYSLREVFLRGFGDLNIPVISGLQCGHSVPSTSLPLGMTAEISSGEDGCRIITPATKY